MLYDILCHDVIHEILKYLDSRSVASWLSVNKYMSTNYVNNNTLINRKCLGEELRHTIVKKRKYYKCHILKFVVGDRLTDRIYNYKVIFVTAKYAIMHIVDMYGNIMDKEVVYTSIYNFKNNKNNLAWATWHQYDNTVIQIKLIYGIMKHKCGPMITDVDSKYLMYETREQHLLMPYLVGGPTLNMLVTVDHKMHIYEYVVIYLNDNKMTLLSLDNNNTLCATKVDKWVIDNCKYSIVMFGGFKYI
jgi:hypothetical protein